MLEVRISRIPVPRSKLDPRLATLVQLGVEVVAPGELERFKEEPETGTGRENLRRTGPLAFLRGGLRGGVEIAPGGAASAGAARRESLPPKVPVFVRTTSGEALDRLAATGIRWVSRAKTIATTELEIGQLTALEEDREVVAIEWTGAFRPLGEGRRGLAGAKAIGLDPERFGDLDGRGCLIGVIDVEGLDLYHPCFVDRRGRSRVHVLWDQRAVPQETIFAGDAERGPGGLGVVYRHNAIELEISPHQLIRGSVVEHRAVKGSHGTLTSALAMGLGDDEPCARGVATGADLAFVSTFGSGPGALGAMNELADAIAFVVGEASALQKPCIVNVSLGDDLGPHDGTSPIEHFIDELFDEPGRAIVIASGNAHGKQRHAEVTLADHGSASFDLRVSRRNTERAVIELWYDASGEPSISLEIEAPGDETRSGVIEADGIARAFDTKGTRALVTSMARYPGPHNARRQNGVIRIELVPLVSGGALDAGTWRFHVSAKGRGTTIHGWVDHRYLRWANPSGSLTLTTPATARRAIVVGALDPADDRAAWFSGRGVDRGGLERPDILAPGVSLVGAWAESPVRYIDLASGTSFAAPLVAGALALLYQQSGPSSSSARIREELLLSTRRTQCGSRALWVEDLPGKPPATTPDRVVYNTSPIGRADPPRARLPRITPRDAAQIVQGHFNIVQNGEPVGELLVLPGDFAGSNIEYWALGPRFLSPSAEIRRIAMTFEYKSSPIPQERFVAGLDRESRLVRAACEVTSARAIWSQQKKSASSALGEADAKSGRHDIMNEKNYMRPLDRTQIVQGVYGLYQGTSEVGALLVTDDSPGVSTEHWLLFTGYAWPSEANPEQEIRFEYKSGAISLTSFLEEVPSGATYIVANCEQQTLP